MNRGKARKLREVIEQASASLPDESALEGVELFPAWNLDRAYDAGQRVRYGNKLYRCEQAHTSQSDWTPPKTLALWTEISVQEWPEWRQPTGAQDAYAEGDKVSHNNKHWISTLDGNVWEPGIYGWEEQL